MPYWITFTEGRGGCVEASSAKEAERIALEATGRRVSKVSTLPYPADPRINTVEHPKYGVCPSFCFDPTRCAGSTACPKPYSCVE